MRIAELNNKRIICSAILDCLEEQECILPNIEIDIVIRLVGYIRSEISTNKSMPVAIESTIQLILEMCCNLLYRVHFVQGISSNQ